MCCCSALPAPITIVAACSIGKAKQSRGRERERESFLEIRGIREYLIQRQYWKSIFELKLNKYTRNIPVNLYLNLCTITYS